MFHVGALVAGLATPSPADRTNIALSTAIVQRVGDRVWPGWSKTPFAIDLLTHHGSAPIGLKLPSPPPAFPPTLEAAFPLSAGGLWTVVIGEPSLTQASTPIRWSVTLLHEHFHQWQGSWKGYQPAIRALGLARKNDNGMWMLNYPFPYSNPTVDRLYATMATSLDSAVESIGTARFHSAALQYLSARHAFRRELSPNDYRYFAFQCWQEGVARFTEFVVAREAAAAHSADPSFLTGAQARALRADSQRTYVRILAQLRSHRLKTGQREDFYSLGAGEALLLDRLRPGWRTQYLNPKMDLGEFLYGGASAGSAALRQAQDDRVRRRTLR